MKLAVVAVGHRMPAWVDAGFADYARRLPRECAIELKEIRPEPRSSGKTAHQLAAAEAVRIRAAIPRGAVQVALDERGRALATAQLAAQLGRWRDEGRDAAFIIGDTWHNIFRKLNPRFHDVSTPRNHFFGGYPLLDHLQYLGGPALHACMDSCQIYLLEALEVINTLVTQRARAGVSRDPVDLREFLLKIIQNGNEIFYGQN